MPLNRIGPGGIHYRTYGVLLALKDGSWMASVTKLFSGQRDDIFYSIPGVNQVNFDDNYEVFIEAGKTYAPGGTTQVDDIDINGIFTMAANAMAVSGTWDATGGSFTSSGTVTFDSTGAETITSDGTSLITLISMMAERAQAPGRFRMPWM